jgi:hypothetical protein
MQSPFAFIAVKYLIRIHAVHVNEKLPDKVRGGSRSPRHFGYCFFQKRRMGRKS